MRVTLDRSLYGTFDRRVYGDGFTSISESSIEAAAQAAVEDMPRLPEPVTEVAERVTTAWAAGAVTLSTRLADHVTARLGRRHSRVGVRHPANERERRRVKSPLTLLWDLVQYYTMCGLYAEDSAIASQIFST